jgi:hypothetical protein
LKVLGDNQRGDAGGVRGGHRRPLQELVAADGAVRERRNLDAQGLALRGDAPGGVDVALGDTAVAR